MVSLSPTLVENIVLSTLALHNVMYKSTFSRNVYHPATLLNSFHDNGNLVETDWRNEETTDFFTR